jgi:hypothetical protein
MTEISNITLDDEFDRTKKYTNKCNFDDATLRRRDIELRELQKTYPNMCSSHLELAWNFCEFTPKEVQDRIIASKEFEQKPKNKRNTGGIINLQLKSKQKKNMQKNYYKKKKKN